MRSLTHHMSPTLIRCANGFARRLRRARETIQTIQLFAPDAPQPPDRRDRIDLNQSVSRMSDRNAAIEKFDDRVGEGVVSVSGHHMTCAGDIDMLGGGTERAEFCNRLL